MKRQLDCNYETWIVLDELRKQEKFVQDVYDIVQSPKDIYDVFRELKDYVERWYLQELKFDKHPLQKQLWDVVYNQVDWLCIIDYFKNRSDFDAIKIS